MDQQTVQVYERIAPEWCARNRGSEPRRLWDVALGFFHPGEPMADIGSGSGRDVAWFDAHGFPTVGFDASAAMRREAVKAFPGIDLRESALPDLAGIPDASFANVWCTAVLMHVPESELTNATANLARILRPGGRLVLSYRASRGPDEREEDGRLFTPIDPDRFGRTLAAAGLSLVRREFDPETERPGVVWTVMLAEKGLAGDGMEKGGRMADDRRPIGYWLKHLDRLIESNFEETLASEGLTRRHWQVLNMLHTRPSTQAEIVDALAPFLVDDPGTERRVIDDLVARGWVEPDQSDLLELTAEGSRAHAALRERVTATRQLLIRGITEEEYRAVIDILRRMADNLESATASGG